MTKHKQRKSKPHSFTHLTLEQVDEFIRVFRNTAIMTTKHIAESYSAEEIGKAVELINGANPGTLLIALGAAAKAYDLTQECNCGRCEITAMTEAFGLFMTGYQSARLPREEMQ